MIVEFIDVGLFLRLRCALCGFQLQTRQFRSEQVYKPETKEFEEVVPFLPADNTLARCINTGCLNHHKRFRVPMVELQEVVLDLRPIADPKVPWHE